MKYNQVAILDTGYESYAFEHQLFAQQGMDLIIYEGDPRNKKAKYEFARNASGILVRELLIDQEALGIMPHLKAIVRYGVGYDNIDLETTRERSIRVANVQGYANHSVSDHAMALMLACTRDLEGSKTGTFSKASRKDVLELHDKTLGIIGIGQIGSQFSLKASPFFNKVLACDPYKTAGHMAKYGAEKVKLSSLFEECQVISLHCNLSQETRHLINQSAIDAMKQRPVIVNTSRGAVIDEKALLAALNSEKVHSAGLDVFEKEPPGEDQTELLNHPHVVYTPHVAWYSQTSIVNLQRKAARNLIGLLNGQQIEDELL
jgi:D-3-phosphoglycerate dehydrogenase